MSVADVASVIAATGSLAALGTSIGTVLYQSKATERLERDKWQRTAVLDDMVAVLGSCLTFRTLSKQRKRRASGTRRSGLLWRKYSLQRYVNPCCAWRS